MNDISPSKVLPTMLFPERFYQNCQGVFVCCERYWVKASCLAVTAHTLQLHLIRTGVVWSYCAFANNLGIELEFAKYLKESCAFGSEHHFPFKFSLLKGSLFTKILLQLSGPCRRSRHKWVNQFIAVLFP